MYPLISVIVPIYKVENYLPKCIDSILNQEYKNLEIFLVDDGSPDLCGKICDEYALKDSRIQVIHKPNGGLSDARNVALNIMTGEYVTFIDSDDYVSPQYISILWKLLNKYKADIAVSQYQAVKGETTKMLTISHVHDHILERDEAVKMMFYQKLFDNSAWGKLYKNYLFKEIQYPKGVIFEDLGTTYKLFLQCNNIAYTSAISYFYLQRKDSIEGEQFNDKKLDAIPLANEMMSTIAKENPQNIKAAKCRCVSLYWHILSSMPKHHPQRQELISFIKKNRYNILVDSNARTKVRIACLLSYLNIF